MTRRRYALAAILATLSVAPLGGCTFLTQVIGAFEGAEIVPAKFKGLEGKRVAVVCIDVNSLYGPGGDSDLLAKAVSNQFRDNVKKIKLVKQSEIHNWMDEQDQAQIDYRDIGRGVNAEMVVGIDLNSFATRDVGTLLKGRANVTVKVFDMNRPEEPVYETPTMAIEFPEHGARHVTENAANFRVAFINVLADKITKDFYAYDRTLDFARDSKFIGD